MVADFWTAKNPGTKHLGLRVYLVDSECKFRSLLLGTRHFDPMYGERDGGIREPIRRWIDAILADSELSTDDFFGATSDGGADVKWMLRDGLNLNWEWCVPHLTNAATRQAFGMSGNRATSKNPRMLDLLTQITKTTYQAKSIEVMSDLYSQLAEVMGFESRKLLTYRDHRFMGLSRVLRRILEHWNFVCQFYEERTRKFEREGKLPQNPFLLEDDKVLLEQLMPLLAPITVLNLKSQKEDANQVDVLLTLYKLRLTVLDCNRPLQRYDSTRQSRVFYHPTELHSLATTTRKLLAERFTKNFFRRYTDRAIMRKTFYVSEEQMLLHPHVKNPAGPLEKMMRLCGEQQRVGDNQRHIDPNQIDRNVEIVKTKVQERLRSIMLSLGAQEQTEAPAARPEQSRQPASGFSEDLSELFAAAQQAPDPVPSLSLHERRVDEELERWFADPITLKVHANGEVESVLDFWKRQHDTNNYHFLPTAARVVFATPASSAQIERDIGVSGMIVTTQRTRLKTENIDMCSFLNRNRELVDITHCPCLTKAEAKENAPQNTTINLAPVSPMEMFNNEWESLITSSFTNSVSIEL